MLHEDFMEKMKKIVFEAGSLIDGKGGREEVQQKEGHANFVTRYDSMVQKYLVEKLGELLPEAVFLGEEDGQSEQDISNGYAFIIDPIDGTNNFIYDFRMSAVSVALSCNGRVIKGCVYNPFRKEMFTAEEGKGAFLNERQLVMSDYPLSEGIAIVDAAPYYMEIRKSTMELAEELSRRALDIRMLGSAALSLCYVACGRGVFYECPRLCTWDYAAGMLIVTEAGGIVNGFDGRELQMKSKIPVAASTPKGMKEFLTFSQDYVF